MSKRSKSKRNMIESKDAAQPRNGEERTTISKVDAELEDHKK
ncbi:hypothetical protein [Halalkalibacter wakoensis]|nr:hypothetical protein [Halalkalibacter wakoensis]